MWLSDLLEHRQRQLVMQRDQVHCIDALKFLRLLPGNYIDMALASPPYDDLRTYNGYSFDFEPIAREAYRVLKPGGVLVWVVGDATKDGSEALTSMRQAIYFVDVVGFKMWQSLVWDKPGTHPNSQKRYPKMHEHMFVLSKGNAKTFNAQMKLNKNAGETKKHIKRQRNGKVETYGKGAVAKYGKLTSVWTIQTGWMHTTKDKAAFDHPAMFPEELARRHILTWTNPGDLVLDFFMGAGTTAKMARVTGRHFIGCDISQEYVDIALKRIPAAYTPDMFETLLPQADAEPEAEEMPLFQELNK